MRIQVVMTLPRETVSVPLTRRTLSATLTVVGVDSDCLAEVEVALSEACNKVLHHAEGEAYEVAINIDDQQVTMDVIDSQASVEPRHRDVSLPDLKAESEPGVVLMRAFTDRATFDSVSVNGWAVHLAKRLRWAPTHGSYGSREQRVGIASDRPHPTNS